MAIEHGYAAVNDQLLHYAAAGSGKLLLFLHGFPDFWYLWRHQLPILGKTHRAVAPDLRGYNLSSKPVDESAYQLSFLVADIAGLIAHFGEDAAIVVGHDWGGAVAWAFAHTYPALVEKLVIINAPHPAIFRRELAQNVAQQAASSYILRFRTPQAEELLSANDYARLNEIVLQPGLQQGYFSEVDQRAYHRAWSQPGAMTAALNYYRANDFVPGMAADIMAERPAYQVFPAPTLVIWGENDTALLTSNLVGLEAFAADLTIIRVPEATHTIIHEQPALINQLIQDFLASNQSSFMTGGAMVVAGGSLAS